MKPSEPKIVITFGTFDLFHIGHLNILQRAASLGTCLIVGVSSDALSLEKKGHAPVFREQDRMKIVNSLKFVDDVFREDSLDLKGDYIRKFSAGILVMGDDWEGKFDEFRSLCEVRYLPRTPLISTTQLRNAIAREL